MDLPVRYDLLSSAKKKKVREEYVKLQDGLCWHCGNSLSGKPHASVTSKSLDMRLFPPIF